MLLEISPFPLGYWISWSIIIHHILFWLRMLGTSQHSSKVCESFLTSSVSDLTATYLGLRCRIAQVCGAWAILVILNEHPNCTKWCLGGMLYQGLNLESNTHTALSPILWVPSTPLAAFPRVLPISVRATVKSACEFLILIIQVLSFFPAVSGKIFDITNHWGYVNQDYNKISTCLSGQLLSKIKKTSFDEDFVEKPESLCSVSRDVKWGLHCTKHYRGSSKKNIFNITEAREIAHS